MSKLTELDQVEKYFLEKASEANYGLWNAILIVNGILVSSFSFIISLAPQLNSCLVKTLVAFCSISIIIILCNYLITKWHYFIIGQQIISKSVPSDRQKQDDIRRSIRRGKLIRYIEFFAIILLLIEITLIFYIVFNVDKITQNVSPLIK